ncbi:DUF1080 domain-containing protein [Cellulophaga sp. Z1A5H]|uniref:3-keto-disaccharide hydrolase n=1 Tax=Cellulophaga sp. Z1A5H TaxID=2687291 RepID=UPI0013FE1220|nr:DUF1080 domain-containing protein [Cellulophaga sp. Z1A5H]
MMKFRNSHHSSILVYTLIAQLLFFIGCKSAADVKVETAKNSLTTNMFDAELTNWEVWIGAVHTSVDLDVDKFDNVQTGTPLGLHKDLKKVFSVQEENGEAILKITGEIYGGLTTKKEYGNYHLSVQFKWGDKKWEPRLNTKRDSGILYHAKGPHGAFWNVWMASAEFQVQERDCGDFIALGDVYGDVPSDKKMKSDGKPYFVYNPEGPLIPLKWGADFESGQASKATLHEKPHGEWNRLEIYCLGNESLHVVNGIVVNRVQNIRYDIDGKTISVTKGKIQLQSEAAEVYYKDLTLTPITMLPQKYKGL